jgi:hypothetical protein
MNFRPISLRQAIGRNILAHHRASADHSHITDLHKLVDTREAADNHTITDDYVTGQRAAISEHASITYKRIVPNVSIGHEKIGITDLRDHTPTGGSRLKRRALTNYVFISNNEFTRLTTEFKILRLRTN